MATVQSHLNAFDPSLEDLPAWKKDLILRRRANARIRGLPARGGGWGAPHSPPTAIPHHSQNPLRSEQGPSQLSLRSMHGQNESLRLVHGASSQQYDSNSGRSWEYCVRSSDVLTRSAFPEACESAVDGVGGASRCNFVGTTDMRGPCTMHHKGVAPPEGKMKFRSNSTIEESEEFEYGPGIVSRLKNRYMSLALREARGRASLRKYSSLEDLLDDGSQERGRSTHKDRTPAGGGGPSSAKEVMKRARSMDSLSYRRNDALERVPKSKSSGALRQALGKEDIIIIESPKPTENGAHPLGVGRGPTMAPKKVSTPVLEEEELPTPDIVKQVKKIFEPPSGKAPRGTAAKVAAYKATHSQKQGSTVPLVKPPLKAKPSKLICKKTSSTDMIESARSSLKTVQVGTRSSPRSTLGIKPSVPLETGGGTPSPGVSPGLTPITASVTAPYVNGEDLKNSSPVVPGKRPDFTPVASSHQDSPPRPHSPPTPLPPSPTPTHKTLSPVHKNSPLLTKEKERVLQENRKNKEKSHKSSKEASPHVPAPSIDAHSRSPLAKPSEQTLLQDTPLQEPSRVSVPSVTNTFRELDASPEKVSPPVSVSLIEPSFNSSPSSGSKDSRPESTSPLIPSTILDVIKAADAKSQVSSPPSNIDSPSSVAALKSPNRGKDASGGRRPPSKQENSSLVFNFMKRSDTPDYIENDGVDLSKRHFKYKHEPGYVIMPGYDGKTDSSTDGDGDEDAIDSPRAGVPPPPCNIAFEGEGVIINGRSNLQRQPRTKKVEVSFDMASTRTFEYPSETCLQEEFDSTHRFGGDSDGTPTIPSVPTGGLACYTPSKLPLSDSFELGISRSTVPYPPTPPKGREPLEKELQMLDDHLRPADEDPTVTWSTDSVPDMLF